MCTQRKPRGSMPSNRILNSGNAVCRKRIVDSMSRTMRLACSSRTVIGSLHASLSYRNRLKIASEDAFAARLVIIGKAPARIHPAIAPLLTLATLESISLPQAVPLQSVMSSWLGDAAGEAGFDDCGCDTHSITTGLASESARKTQ